MLKIILIIVTSFITLAAFSARHIQPSSINDQSTAGYSSNNVKLVKKLLTE
jgi:hypothetical protein